MIQTEQYLMQQPVLPSTPTNIREKAERTKHWLSSEWDLNFIETDSVYKPYRYLSFQRGDAEGALQHALDLFNEQAQKLQSQWVSKPHADADLLPSRLSRANDSNYLKTKRILTDQERAQLMECLLEKLILVGNRVRDKLPFRQTPVQHSIEHADQHDSPKLRLKGQKSQSRLDLYFRSKSAPNPPSSQFSDSDAESLFRDLPTQDLVQAPEEPPLEKNDSHSSSSSIYRTPPTTPKEISNFKRPFKRSITEASTNLDAQVEIGQPRKRSSNLSARSISEGSFTDASTRTSFTGSNNASTAASSNLTSPNTSFSAAYSNTVSRTTSFDFSTESEATIRADLAWPEKGAQHAPIQVKTLEGPTKDSEPRTKMFSIGQKFNSNSVLEELKANPPFEPNVPEQHVNAPYHQVYEVQRVAQHCQLDFQLFSHLLQSKIENYDQFWASLTAVVRLHSKVKPPEKSHSKAWEGTTRTFEDVSYSGSLEYVQESRGPMFRFQLKALRADNSHRLARKYGSDRFIRIGFPGLEATFSIPRLKVDPVLSQNNIVDWLVKSEHCFLGRRWRAFFVKQNRSLKFTKGADSEDRFHLFFFAEDGPDFIDKQLPGEADQRHVRLTVAEMLYWLFPPSLNADQLALKLFARITLAVSKTRPTVIFKYNQIFRTRDACGHDPRRRSLTYTKSCNGTEDSCPLVMNDGCARISQAAAICIKQRLGLDFIPCAVQGRINGAKGMWIVDTLDEKPLSNDIWIEITDSQLKYEGHKPHPWDLNEARHTLEINDFVKRLSPASLNFQLMPILTYGGVPDQVFKVLLENELTAKVSHLKAATDDCKSLRLWSQRNNPVAEERARQNGIELCGGLPALAAEKINWFLDCGFDPLGNQFLKEILFQCISGFCQRLAEKADVIVGRSTYAFMIADPTGTLEEDEVHLAFSNSFHDPASDFDDTMLHDLNVLVARLPAHLPSDIQKVRAVFKPELKTYRDVIVFPSKGSRSLASKLSGGDYDGDRAWVCWDPQIAQPFKNSELPQEISYTDFGIIKDDKKASSFIEKDRLTTDFIRHGLEFNLQPGMLGKCTYYHEALCYRENPKTSINDPQALAIGMLLGLLVDSAKGGFTFNTSIWKNYLKSQGLHPYLPKPKYKEPSKYTVGSTHLIDQLVFQVAKQVSTKALEDFWRSFKVLAPRDEDLVRLSAKESEAAKSNPELKDVLECLKVDIEKLHNDFTRNRCSKDEDSLFTTTKTAVASESKFRALVENCRSEFCTIAPRLKAGDTATMRSDRILEWQQAHSKGESSYWDLLKASVAYAGHSKSKFVWHMAGLELGEIKATARGRKTYRSVRNEIFNSFRVDAKFVEGIKRREDFEGMVAGAGASVLGDGDDDGDEWEYGTCPDWEDAFS